MTQTSLSNLIVRYLLRSMEDRLGWNRVRIEELTISVGREFQVFYVYLFLFYFISLFILFYFIIFNFWRFLIVTIFICLLLIWLLSWRFTMFLCSHLPLFYFTSTFIPFYSILFHLTYLFCLFFKLWFFPDSWWQGMACSSFLLFE